MKGEGQERNSVLKPSRIVLLTDSWKCDLTQQYYIMKKKVVCLSDTVEFLKKWGMHKGQRARTWCEDTVVHRLLGVGWLELSRCTLRCLGCVWICSEGLVLWEIKIEASWS